VRNVLRDLEVSILTRVYAFTRGRLARLSEQHPRASAGGRVFHQQYGCGAILLVQGHKLVVCFDRVAETKWMVESFCEPVFDAYDRKSPKAFGA
jgi:hypothetical protein